MGLSWGLLKGGGFCRGPLASEDCKKGDFKVDCCLLTVKGFLLLLESSWVLANLLAGALATFGSFTSESLLFDAVFFR